MNTHLHKGPPSEGLFLQINSQNLPLLWPTSLSLLVRVGSLGVSGQGDWTDELFNRSPVGAVSAI